jgi:hypothetical protein
MGMNVYTAMVHQQRAQLAEDLRLRLAKIQGEIISKCARTVKDSNAYPTAERTADSATLNAVQSQLTAALDAMLDIESD